MTTLTPASLASDLQHLGVEVRLGEHGWNLLLFDPSGEFRQRLGGRLLPRAHDDETHHRETVTVGEILEGIVKRNDFAPGRRDPFHLGANPRVKFAQLSLIDVRAVSIRGGVGRIHLAQADPDSVCVSLTRFGSSQTCGSCPSASL